MCTPDGFALPDEPMRVLVAHPDPIVAQNVKRILGVAGYRSVTAVTNGRRTVEKITLGCFIILITAVHLPDIQAGPLIALVRSGRFVFAPRVIIVLWPEPDAAVIIAPWAVPGGGALVPEQELDRLAGAIKAALAGIPRPHVLVIEDDEASAQIARSCLEPWFRVDVAQSAKEGLVAYRARSYELVLLDLMLPDASGDAVLRTIKSMHPGQPVVVVTANASPETELSFPLDATLGLLPKPYDIALLRRACHRALATAHASFDYAYTSEDTSSPLRLTDGEWDALVRSVQ